MRKLFSILVICLAGSATLQAQIVRPFTVRYNNPSVRGNIVYVSNSIMTTNGSSGTGEMPPAGSSTNNAGVGLYIDIDDPTPIPNDTLFKYNSTTNLWKYWSNSLLNEPASTWITPGFSDAAWPTGTGSSYYYNDAGGTDVGFGADNMNRYRTVYFRKTFNITNPSDYTSFNMNLRRDDGAVVYINGIEVHRVNLPASPTAITYSTAALASYEGNAGVSSEYETVTLPISAFAAGSNTIAVEVHNYNTGRNPAGETDLHFDMQLVGMKPQPVDNSGTFASSSADLNLASCSKVLWAGIYWGADQGVSGTNSTWMTGIENTLKVKVPGSSTYTAVTAQQINYHNATSSSIAGFNHTGYTAFAEITSLLNVNSANGTYTVADVLGPAGINNTASGWTIVIAFENPSLVPRNLSVFDGHVIIDGGAAAVDIAINGFLTPPSGSVSCELGGVVFDGDRVSQDAFQFQQSGAGSFYDLATTAAYPLNGAADAWNSKISYKGSIVTSRVPAFNNTLGYDATIMELPNASNAQLGNNQSAATVRFSSPSENYIVQVLSTSISQFNPEFVLTKAATDVNGTALVGGDVLRYRIDYQNVGNDISANSIVLDNIPAGSTFKPGSLSINGVLRTDASGDDQAEFDPANNRVVFRVGTGANAANGGQVAVGASGYVEFDVYVASSCNVLNCANPLSNTARMNYVGNTSLVSLYDSSGTMVSGCFLSGPVISTVTGSCYIPRDTFMFNQCPIATVAFPLAQYGGYRFYSAMPFTDANAINPDPTYSSSRIIYAYWNNGVCSDTVTIRIYITPCPDIDDDNDGIPDYVEANDPAALLDHDSDGVPNYADAQYPGFVDFNSDNINDLFDPSADADNDGTPNFIDINFAGFIDDNGDGVHDLFDADNDGIPNHLDLDSDNDGIPDVVESYGVDVNGDGRIDNYTDTDNDGLSQNVDGDNAGTTGSGSGLGAADLDGDGIPNYFDLDSDGDGVPDIIEVSGTDSNNNGMVDTYTDADGDGFHDPYDGDAGNDATAENAANALLRTGADNNNDGRADSYPYKNMDADTRTNPYDLDSDGDGITDVTEAAFSDADYDGKADGANNGRGWNASISMSGVLLLPNRDLSGAADLYDIDSDDDGIPDNIEGQLTNTYALPSGLDADGDGIDNNYDDISGFAGRGITPCNIDGDPWPDYLDLDTDGDGLEDLLEGNDLNFNMFPDDNIVLAGTDTDGDGLDDFFDLDNTSAQGTSAYMGNGGSLTGDPTPGSKTVVQRSYPSYDRDWRALEYILALQFIDFKGAVQPGKVQLNWTVANQDGIDYYIVQRSTDRHNFTNEANVLVKQGTNDRAAYQTYDDISSVNVPVVYYKIIAVYVDGQEKISPVLVLNLHSDFVLKMQVMPMPVRNTATVSIQSKITGIASFTITDMQGKTLDRFETEIQAGTTAINRNEITNLPNGMYSLVMSINGIITNYRFQVSR